MTETPAAPIQSVGPVAPPMRHRRWWRTILLGSLILVCGIVIGVGGTILAGRHIMMRFMHHPENLPGRITARIQRTLRLSEDQTQKVGVIVARHAKVIQKLRQEIHPRVTEQLDQLREEVAAELNPRQQAEWRKRFTWLQGFLPPHVVDAEDPEHPRRPGRGPEKERE